MVLYDFEGADDQELTVFEGQEVQKDTHIVSSTLLLPAHLCSPRKRAQTGGGCSSGALQKHVCICGAVSQQRHGAWLGFKVVLNLSCRATGEPALRER